MIYSKTFFAVFALFLSLSFSTASAQTLPPGTTEGAGTHFSVTDSQYLNVVLDSSEEVKLRMESVPEMITVQIEPSASSTATSTQVALFGLATSTTYYKYEDDYHHLAVFTTDVSGSYSYTQDISTPHLIFIQPRHSTKFIKNDATGGDCTLIGVWDSATKTCTLTTDLNETIEIDSYGVTLDGNNHTLTGSNTGNGVYVNGVFSGGGVTVKNFNIKNFVQGIYVYIASNSTLTNNTVSNTYLGINLNHSSYSTLSGNNITLNNRYYGIRALFSEYNTFTGNVIANSGYGIELASYAVGNILTDNTISNNGYGFGPSWPGNQIYNNNFINNLVQVNIFSAPGNTWNLPLPIGGNYWSNFDTPSEGCSDANNDNICDAPYVFARGQDDLPWTKQDGWKQVPVNQPPTLSTPTQLKSDGVTPISEGSITSEPTVIFGATLTDPDNDQVKLQVELKEAAQPFDGTFLESGFVPSGTSTTTVSNLIPEGKYHWRARAVDDKNNASAWQEFGMAGNVDFEVKLAPLYTQGFSDFPSQNDTKSWAPKTYAGGRGNLGPVKDRCGLSIGNCGCAITSMVMLGRYYGVDTAIDGTSVDPLSIDTWLTSHNGYAGFGKVYWGKAVNYLGFVDSITNKKMVRFAFNEKNDWNVSSTSPRIANYLNSGQPIVAFNDKVGHYLILDNKLSTGYTVKDPAWYNTKTLTDSQNLNNHIRGYGNYFKTANIFTYLPTPKLATASLHIALASPAELLLVDPQGRKLGKDPVTNTVYDEIPNAIYGNDGPIVSSDFDLDPSQIHQTKEIHIETPLDGAYQLQVIGTGAGSYGLELTSFDPDGGTQNQQFDSETIPGHVTPYDISFDSVNATNTGTKIADEIAPEVKISFSTSTQQLIVQGMDNVTLNPIVSSTEQNNEIVYQIKDEAGNTTSLTFSKIKQEGNEIKTELKSLQYNNTPIIKFPKTELNYEWSADKNTGEIKVLEQKIESKDAFEVQAKYNRATNVTEIKTETNDGKETKQTLPGFIIIKLTTKLGVAGVEW